MPIISRHFLSDCHGSVVITFFFYFVTPILVPIVIRKMTVEVEGHQNHDRGHGALGKLSFDILSNISLADCLGFHYLPVLHADR